MHEAQGSIPSPTYWVWRCQLVILALWRWRQEDKEFEASLEFMRPFLKIKKQRQF